MLCHIKSAKKERKQDNILYAIKSVVVKICNTVCLTGTVTQKYVNL